MTTAEGMLLLTWLDEANVDLIVQDTVTAALPDIEAAAEQRGRDQWLHATAHGARQWEGLLARFDLAEDADANAVIAAARADTEHDWTTARMVIAEFEKRVAALEGALERLLPSDAIIDSCGDYEDIEVGYRCQGWQAREWRALAAPPVSPAPNSDHTPAPDASAP